MPLDVDLSSLTVEEMMKNTIEVPVEPEDYASLNVVLDMRPREGVQKIWHFKEVMDSLRKASRTKFVDDKSLLDSQKLINLDLLIAKLKKLRMKVRNDNLYVIGFMVADGIIVEEGGDEVEPKIVWVYSKLWELRPKIGGVITLQGSEGIDIGVNYKGANKNLLISAESLINAVQFVIKKNQFDREMKKHIVLIIVMMIESARFIWISEDIQEILSKDYSEPIHTGGYMRSLMKDWEHMSGYALEAPSPPIKNDYKSYDTDTFDCILFDGGSKNRDVSLFDRDVNHTFRNIASKFSLGINYYLDPEGRQLKHVKKEKDKDKDKDEDEDSKAKKWNSMGKKNGKGKLGSLNQKLREAMNMETGETSKSGKKKKKKKN